MRQQPPQNRYPLALVQLLDRLFVCGTILLLVGRVGRFDIHKRPMGKGVPAHDTHPRRLAERELHPEVRKAEQVVFPERESIVASIGERSGDRISPIGDPPHHPARVVIESIMECADGLDVCNDRGSENIRVTQDDVLAKLVWFIDCTCVHKRGECRAQRVARKPDVDLRSWREILAEARCSLSDCIPDCIYRKSRTLGYR